MQQSHVGMGFMTSISNGQVMQVLIQHAKDYREKANDSIKLNSHMNESTGNPIPQEDIDALLVDYLNYVAAHACGIDLALYTFDLEIKRPAI